MTQLAAQLHGIYSFFTSSRLVTPVDHFARHPTSWTPFEGYYTRIQTLDDNSTLVLIFSTVHRDHLDQYQSANTSTRPSSHSQSKWHAKPKSHFILFALIPSPTSTKKRILIERYPKDEDVSYTLLGPPTAEGRQSFELRARDSDAQMLDARFVVDNVQGVVEYAFAFGDVTDEELGETSRSEPPRKHKHMLSVLVTATRHTPLRRGPGNALHTPHSPFVELGAVLPLHWHVYSTCSDTRYRVETRPADASEGLSGENGGRVVEGNGLAHIEKNWGRGFPQGWTWIQAFSPASQTHTSDSRNSQDSAATLALAGGTTGVLNLVSYLAIYRSPSHQPELTWDFTVPWTILFPVPQILFGTAKKRKRIHHWGPFVTEEMDGGGKAARIVFRGLCRKLVVRVRSEEDISHWLPLDCPLISGHGNVAARETFNARITVNAYVRPLARVLFAELWRWMSIWSWRGRVTRKRDDEDEDEDGSPFWTLVETRTFENAAFELGGSYRSEEMLELDKGVAGEKFKS